jgi:predicted nucleic acid-binding protein
METYRVLTDTSVIIDFLRKENKEKAILWKIRERNECFMSSVTFFELQCGVKTARHIEDIDRLCRWIKSIPLDNEIAEIASIIYHDLKRKNEIIEFRDIFIAATAIAENFCVATLNQKHFERIKDVTLLKY